MRAILGGVRTRLQSSAGARSLDRCSMQAGRTVGRRHRSSVLAAELVEFEIALNGRRQLLEYIVHGAFGARADPVEIVDDCA